MQHYYSLDGVFLKDAWLTIGTFDGVHLGHQAILHKMTEEAHQNHAPAVVLTFHPRPALVLGKKQGSYYLTDPEERAELIAQLGVDVVVTYPFSLQVAGRSAIDFIEELQNHLQMKMIWAGPDFAMGRNREGDLNTLRRLGDTFGFQLKVSDQITIGNEAISSTRVRLLLEEGAIADVNRMLGRGYQVRGKVIPGDGRGRTIGIPTANLDVWPEKQLPKPGVYVCQAHLTQALNGAVVNVGYRPTFETRKERPLVEAHLLDLDVDLYGQVIQLDFIERLRDEQRFPSVPALVEQIESDIIQARTILNN